MAGITKALSVKQPWAELIALGIKDIENRTWKTKFRGRVYIHASKVKDTSSRLSKEREDATNCIEEFKLDLGCIIGEVDIVDCVQNSSSIWADKGEYVYHWKLANAVFYDKPIEEVKGKLGIWNININNYTNNGE
ncbi:ASCH domain-containing protein [Myroides sp. LoEW2-1]|uniref:ASCH domain-containing protein n=1 Tax=Myroides sp. LoEW2-1 TaxID=2683192 RepID=UPI00132CC186|nr:ASCH domain-containing protein [Myroides sp. LoEW2-1]MVX37252.1 ASCH domain-containing protein [Myroides sp. LoEW2-1]